MSRVHFFYEIYEMFKTRDIGELFQIWMGITLAVGVAIRYFGKKGDIDKYEKKMKG